MITRIQSIGQLQGTQTKLAKAATATEEGGKADFSKLLFDAFRAQNKTFFGVAAGGSRVPSGVSRSGGTNVNACWGKKGISISDEELNRIFEEASKKYQVPLALLKAVAKAESDFDPNEVSSSGAIGIMQLMPETAKGLGVTNPYDPEQNIMGGAKYLADKLKMYNGDVELALAAYNAGSGSVAKYGGVPPFKETQSYIKKVLAYMNNA